MFTAGTGGKPRRAIIALPGLITTEEARATFSFSYQLIFA